MTLQETVSKIVGKEVTIEFAMEFANNQFGLLATYLREKAEISVDKAKDTLVILYVNPKEKTMDFPKDKIKEWLKARTKSKEAKVIIE